MGSESGNNYCVVYVFVCVCVLYYAYLCVCLYVHVCTKSRYTTGVVHSIVCVVCVCTKSRYTAGVYISQSSCLVI